MKTINVGPCLLDSEEYVLVKTRHIFRIFQDFLTFTISDEEKGAQIDVIGGIYLKDNDVEDTNNGNETKGREISKAIF